MNTTSQIILKQCPKSTNLNNNAIFPMLSLVASGIEVTGLFAPQTIRPLDYSASLDDSPLSHVASKTTRPLVNSPSGQLAQMLTCPTHGRFALWLTK